MTVRCVQKSSDVIFDVSGERIEITKISDGQPKTLIYDSADPSDTILSELEYLAQNQPGIFRLLYLSLAPWAKTVEIFVHYSKMYSITL